MVSTRVRCTNCRSYILREDVFMDAGIGRFCSSECVAEKQAAARAKKRAVKRSSRRREHKTTTVRKQRHIPLEVRDEVHKRDGCCRWCGGKGSQVHHVLYRSQGGPDTPDNLVLLCQPCHERAHTSKSAFQEVLLTYLWGYYATGVAMMIPEIARRMELNGELSELQKERFGFG